MHTTGCYGGIALGAFADGRLVGYSYAVPGFDGDEPFLLSCGLAVSEAYASRGIGAALKLAQAERARKAGYAVIRWTTNSLASKPLHLYLSKLGGRLVAFHRDMYAAYRETLFPDEVEIEWHLRERRPPAEVTESRCVEVPWDRAQLSSELAREWVERVRAEVPALLAEGYVGTAVIADRPGRRSHVRFERP